MLVVVRGVDQHLEGFCVEEIYKKPYAYHSRKVKEDVQQVFLHGFTSVGEGNDHD